MPDANSYLTFSELRYENRRRCAESFKHSTPWTVTDWSTAVAGEVGEACNLIKKTRRDETVPLEAIASEIADAVIYLDLLADHLGIDLGTAVEQKFDEVSKRVGSKRFLQIHNFV